jgi:SAM-dependent methyltransferase
LIDIEDGGIYGRRGISNFLEGDFFQWYLNSLSSPRLLEAIREIPRALADFEPATSYITPEITKDLLKKLYQYLIPKEVRHKLGEYYTPDWLAEFMLNETGYSGNTIKRVLDPACGSGTFLVLAIQKAKEYGKIKKENRLETAKRILKNIWGFDLNPLAIIATRTNYLFALGELIDELNKIEIPVYLADSVLWPERTIGQMELESVQGDSIRIQTSAGDFHVPRIWLKNKGLFLQIATPIVEECVKHKYESEIALARLKDAGCILPGHLEAIKYFYEELVGLDKDGKNGIWIRFIKNAFAPVMAGKFDYVVGNPPWIRWVYLSQEYKHATLKLWKDYGLFSLKGYEARLGGGEKDFSMLFVYTASNNFLKNGGILGFLITQEIFKSKGAGEGFRRFQFGNKNITYLKVLKAHDFTTLQPFEGATNKTAAIFLKKGEKTKYPVSYTLWVKKKGAGKISSNANFHQASSFLQKKKFMAQPIDYVTSSWQTVSEDQESLKKIFGKNQYQARLGARIEPYGVFWIEIKEVFNDETALINNLHNRGKRKVKPVNERIETSLIYPAVIGADIERWKAIPSIHIIMTQNPSKREPHPESLMKLNWPRTYNYLVKFKDILLSRGSKTVRNLAERTSFYSMFAIGDYTVARYKVIWKRMANDIHAAVISQHKTVFGFKTIIPSDTTSLFATQVEDEAHYLCATINSIPVREFIKTYSSAGRGFGTPSVMKHVGIPKYDPTNLLHNDLAKTSRILHELKIKDSESNLIVELEKQVDEFARFLFGISEW